MLIPFAWGIFWLVLPLALALTLAFHAVHLHGLRHPRPHFRLLQKTHHHLGVALVAAVAAGTIAGAAAATGYRLLYGPHGLLEPPESAQRPSGAPGGGARARGLRVRPGHVGPPTFAAMPVPAAVDLSGWAPPVGDQGHLNSCASWAVGYGLASYYARRGGHPIPGGGAPMFVYSLATHGRNRGTSFQEVYRLLAHWGVDSRAHYRQGDYNYWMLPTLRERLHALRWRSAGYRTLFVGQRQGPSARAAIAGALAAGDPVSLGVPVYDNLLHAGPRSYYIARALGQNWGGHALVAYKYDPNGVWAEGSWGTSWGLGGWIELSWPFIERYALEADIMVTRSHP